MRVWLLRNIESLGQRLVASVIVSVCFSMVSVGASHAKASPGPTGAVEDQRPVDDVTTLMECRGLAIMHTMAPSHRSSRASKNAAQVLLEQIDFVLGEVFLSSVSKSVDQSLQRIRMLERMMLSSTGESKRGADDRGSLPGQEEQILQCISDIWRVMRVMLDDLMTLRSEPVVRIPLGDSVD